MKFIKDKLSRNYRILQIILFLIFLGVGLFTSKDYGISYDEREYRQQGFIVINFLSKKLIPEYSKKLTKERNLEYPPIDEYFVNNSNNFKIKDVFYGILEFIFHKNSEKADIYYFRHLLNFFVASLTLIFLIKLLRVKFSRFVSLLGGFAFILTPRLYANFFYNPNDIWSTFALVACLFFIFKIINKDKLKYIILFSFFLSLAINIRYINIYIYPIFILFFFISKNHEKTFYKKVTYQLLSFLIFLFIMNPQLWFAPQDFFLILFNQVNFNIFSFDIMFMGNNTNVENLPWNYLIIWILISSPLIVLLFSIIGIIYFLFNICKDLVVNKKISLNSNDTIIFLYLFIPLFAFVIIKPAIYSGWRHFYFVYIGLIYFFCYFLNLIQNSKKKYFKSLIFIAVFSNLYLLTSWMYKNHPYQNIYFNSLFKKYANKFELDYWGLSNLNALKYLAKQAENNSIKVSNYNDRSRIDFSFLMLKSSDKKKLILSEPDEPEVNYFISNINSGLDDQDYKKLGYTVIYKIYVDDTVINRILKKD